MPNPLTDELSEEAKIELSAMFAELRRRYQPPVEMVLRQHRRQREIWELRRRGW